MEPRNRYARRPYTHELEIAVEQWAAWPSAKAIIETMLDYMDEQPDETKLTESVDLVLIQDV